MKSPIFISNDLYESAAAQEHYSEQLFLLHDLGSLAYYYPPELKQPLKRRADFGLDEADHLYICPQNLFKFHPDMDEIIAGILRRDARGKLLVIEGRVGHWTDMMRRRWAAAMPVVREFERFFCEAVARLANVSRSGIISDEDRWWKFRNRIPEQPPVICPFPLHLIRSRTSRIRHFDLDQYSTSTGCQYSVRADTCNSACVIRTTQF